MTMVARSAEHAVDVKEKKDLAPVYQITLSPCFLYAAHALS